MVFFNYTTMQASAKIVYYGPGLCGKTTNLQHIHAKTAPNSRGEMVSLETEADRTLFFDLLPLEVGTIGGMRVRLQLYTVPGQVFYNTTRKLVLKGVDGVVFVADSQVPALDANHESFQNLLRNLEELKQPFEKIAFIFQYNKRDLRNIHPVDVLNRSLNPKGWEVHEAAALHGVGVFETLKAISKKTLAAVHRRISGEEISPDRIEVPSRVSQSGLLPPAPTQATPRSPVPSSPLPSLPRETAAVAPVEKGTDEVKVEFAASASTSKVSDQRAVSLGKVATKSRLDIELELEDLRQLAMGKKSSSTLRSKQTAEDKTLPHTELGRQLKLKLPRETLEKASHVILDFSVGAEGYVHKATERVRIDLPSPRSGKKTTLRITLDLESEED